MARRAALIVLAGFAISAGFAEAEGDKGGAELTYFGRSTVKIRTASGFVVYVDPYANGDYSEAADLVLVTHGHSDHNVVRLTTRKTEAAIVAPVGAVRGFPMTSIKEGEEKTFGPVTVRALPAANGNHSRGSGFGYLISFDGIVIYHAGDTSYVTEMEGMKELGIGWALLPCDGFFNMGSEEASRVATAIGAKRVVPIHSAGTGNFNAANARAVASPETIVLEPGKSLRLVP